MHSLSDDYLNVWEIALKMSGSFSAYAKGTEVIALDCNMRYFKRSMLFYSVVAGLIGDQSLSGTQKS